MNQKLSNLEKKLDASHIKKDKYKTELELLKQDYSSLLENIYKLKNDLAVSMKTINCITKENNELKEQVNTLTNELELQTATIFQLNEYKENYTILRQNLSSQSNLDVSNNKITQIINKQSPLDMFLKLNLLGNVVNYLDINEICYLKLVNSTICNLIENDKKCSSIYYHALIKIKNNEIIKLKNYNNVADEYNIKESEVEKLFREYVVCKKVPGKELSFTLSKVKAFIEKEVKVSLGINKKPTESTANTGYMS